jgi:2',3'-cyclic-nucleotide 2'-phosphodiesterase
MKILYLGDIMGKPGRQLVKDWLPELRREHNIDFVIAQGENLSHGKGMQVAQVQDLLTVGVDFFTGGDWTLHRPEIHEWLEDATKPVVRPANYKAGTPGRGWKIAQTSYGNILIVSLLGHTVGYRAPDVDNPLHTIDAILEETKHQAFAARIVNFHGDYSSEKRVIGQYLDGRVTAVVGDHWHVPTADAQVLPGGTAHVTDVGMVGSYDSSLGIKTDVIVRRWLSDDQSRNELETGGRMWLCGLIIEVHGATGLAKTVQQVIKFGEF